MTKKKPAKPTAVNTKGGAYAAGNWLEVGLTQGRSRGDRERRIQVPPKAVYVYPLSGQARQRLCR